MKTARLVFEDGTLFEGQVFSGDGERLAEVVFNTGMTGYQEILTDPSYCGQMVIMTYPLVGNYGINAADAESRGLFLSALLVKEVCFHPSSWRSEQSLPDYLEANHVLGVQGLDTRALTRYVREKGAQKAIVTTLDTPIEDLISRLKSAPGMVGQNLVSQVTCGSAYEWPCDQPRYRVGVIDCGVKYNILKLFADNGCQCTVFPASVEAKAILDHGFDGVFISNGPGDPEPVTSVIDLLKTLMGKVPLFGICLGHQLMGLAFGAKTYKLKFGHHGLNHPVKNLRTGQVEITSQNHGFCVDPDSMNSADVTITHLNLNDQTVEGLRHNHVPAFSVQYHPEAAPGPQDSHYLFSEFITMMKVAKNK